MLWLRQLLDELGYSQQTTTIQQDNTGCIQLSENNKHHQRTNHIDIRHHFIKDLVLNDVLKLVFCNSENMIADLFTKSLPRSTFEKLCGKLNLFTTADFRARGAVEECSYSANYINLQSFVLPLLKKIDSDFDPSEKEIGGVAFSDCPCPGVSFSDCP